MAAQETTVIVSEWVYSEVLPKLIREGNSELVQRYKDYFQHNRSVMVEPVNTAVISSATQLRADYGLKTIDALHLATAMTL